MSGPKPWTPMRDPTDIKVMGKLAEELGECSAIAARCIIQGIDGIHPRTGMMNEIPLAEELADVLANIDLVMERFGVPKGYVEQRRAFKKKFLREWHQMMDAVVYPGESQ